MFTKYIKHRNKLNRKENLLMDILHCDPHKPPQNHVKCWFLGNLSCNSNNSRNPVPPTKFSHSTAIHSSWQSHPPVDHQKLPQFDPSPSRKAPAKCNLSSVPLPIAPKCRIGCTLEKQFPEGRLTASTLAVPLQSTTSRIQMGIYVD